MDFSSLAPRRISYVGGGLITAVAGIMMMPWKLYADAAAYIFTWWVGYSSLMGAIGGSHRDYWVLRRQELSSADLVQARRPLHIPQRSETPRGLGARARSCAGRAWIPSRRGHAWRPGRQPDVLDTLYTYAWFVTLGLSFVLYLALSRRASHEH